MLSANTVIEVSGEEYQRWFLWALTWSVEQLDAVLDDRTEGDDSEGFAIVADSISDLAESLSDSSKHFQRIVTNKVTDAIGADPSTTVLSRYAIRDLITNIVDGARADGLLSAVQRARSVLPTLETQELAGAHDAIGELERLLRATITVNEIDKESPGRNFAKAWFENADPVKTRPTQAPQAGSPTSSPSDILEGLLHAAAYFEKTDHPPRNAGGPAPTGHGQDADGAGTESWLIRRKITLKAHALCERGHQTQLIELGLQTSGLGPDADDYPLSAVLCGTCGGKVIPTVNSDIVNRFPSEIEEELRKITREYDKRQQTRQEKTSLEALAPQYADPAAAGTTEANLLVREYASLCPPYGTPLAYGYANVLRLPGEGLRLVFQSEDRTGNGSPRINVLLEWQSPATAKFGGRLYMEDGSYLIFGGRKAAAQRVARILNDG